MISIYQQIPGSRGYEQSDLRFVDTSIVNLLMGDKPALVQRLFLVEPLKKKEVEDFGVNYGPSGRKGFSDAGMIYEINAGLRRMTSSRRKENLFYDRDRIPLQRHFMVEASIKDILRDFEMEWRKVA